MTEYEPLPEKPDEPTAQIPVIWRIVAIVIAVVIIAALLWPRLRQQTGQTTQPANTAAEVAPDGQASDSPADAPAEPTAATLNPEIAAATSAEDLFKLGQSYYQQNRWEDAIAAYQKATEIDPTYQAAYVNLGDTYYQHQKLDQAIEAYQKALELVPDDAEVIYNLGATYFQQAAFQGQLNEAGLEQALTFINRAIELNPELAEPYFALGTAHQLLGQTDLALQNFEKFLELDTGSDPIATENAKQTIEQLKAGGGQ